MTRRLLDDENPDRLYIVTGGRTRPADDAFDSVTLVVAEGEATPGMQSEHAAILRLSREPIAVVELSAELRLPVSVVRILLGDLHAMGKITARHPSARRDPSEIPTPDFLKQVLVGLRNI
ncbi:MULTISPECIES: DUF742 domain-containing protein [Saccharopolyspora]|jgi:hypothetical protein|uniref:DUF742 domain-containing protein n=2 Tax=Saccharopolyspora TaxID=1835 RepID=A0A4R4VCS3_9PSEU|nr:MULTISPECIES: DUF742 domain-containing protein [Saccharopolyspora]MBQ0923666.1 DUF742 domain-containing protein [Saccharopolyspora endophytica]TDD00303.1 DUF742 domain-containing protein [Saccharopolyspora terrae]